MQTTNAISSKSKVTSREGILFRTQYCFVCDLLQKKDTKQCTARRQPPRLSPGQLIAGNPLGYLCVWLVQLPFMLLWAADNAWQSSSKAKN